jgi:hypothetical protein
MPNGSGRGAGTAQPAFVGVCDGAPGNDTPAPAAGGAGGNADNPGGAGQSVPGDSITDGARGNAGSGATGGSGIEDFAAVGEPSIGRAAR